jgi:hypothetical protein
MRHAAVRLGRERESGYRNWLTAAAFHHCGGVS